jgi:hypothetical protein
MVSRPVQRSAALGGVKEGRHTSRWSANSFEVDLEVIVLS